MTDHCARSAACRSHTTPDRQRTQADGRNDPVAWCGGQSGVGTPARRADHDQSGPHTAADRLRRAKAAPKALSSLVTVMARVDPDAIGAITDEYVARSRRCQDRR